MTDSAPLSGPAPESVQEVDPDDLGQAFIVPPADGPLAPMAYYAKLLPLEQFEHLRDGEAQVAFLFRTDTKVKQGRHIIGTCHMPKVQGELSGLFDFLLERFFDYRPDFLVVLDHEWWMAATERVREILVYHEIQHAGQKVDRFGEKMYERESGRPIWTIVGHDVEEFTATVQRYGAWNTELELFVAAARAGNARDDRIIF